MAEGGVTGAELAALKFVAGVESLAADSFGENWKLVGAQTEGRFERALRQLDGEESQ